MSSKKAIFESKDPSHGANGAEGAVATRKSEDETPVSKATDAPEPTKFSEIDFATGKSLESKLAERPSFYTRDPDLGEATFTPKEEGRYTGAERRQGGTRRAGNERRNDVRFDLEKKDRRKNNGRREGDTDLEYW